METTKPRLTMHENDRSTVNVNDAPPNPWTKAHWNLTKQGQVFTRDLAEADRLARAAGHRNALTARIKNAR
jgi:hypothetical protein